MLSCIWSLKPAKLFQLYTITGSKQGRSALKMHFLGKISNYEVALNSAREK